VQPLAKCWAPVVQRGVAHDKPQHPCIICGVLSRAMSPRDCCDNRDRIHSSQMLPPPHSLHLLCCRPCGHELPGRRCLHFGQPHLPLPGMKFTQCGVVISFVLSCCTSGLAFFMANSRSSASSNLRLLFLGVSLWPAPGTDCPHSAQNFASAPCNLPQQVQTRTLIVRRRVVIKFGGPTVLFF